MSQILIQAAVSSIKPAHATYYGKIDEKNPVILATEQELKEVVEYFTKKSLGNQQSAKISSDVPSRGGTLLFNIWNKYEPRWPIKIFHQRMVEMGDKLLSLNAIEVAIQQCYRRFLLTRYEVDPYHVDQDIENYQQTFFPKDQLNEDAVLTARAMIGMSLCKYKLLKREDPYLENDASLELCLKILHGIRAFMQCLMAHERFCWLQYNSTIVIYQICHDLMSSGHSIKVVEYLLWASVTMESSIPLLCIKYLEWRTCLYSAVCHAYYDCNASKHAEDFASRALSKINELSELEKMSSESDNPHHQLIYRKVTHVMASLVFKRLVFESRRKPKGLLRPKVKNSLKEASQRARMSTSGKNKEKMSTWGKRDRAKNSSSSGKNTSWPRTETEKYLYGMFQGSSAQFLAILEALTQAHKRVFHTGEFDSEHEINEVVTELFFAAKEIIAGGGGNTSSMASSADHSTLAGVRNDKSMKELAANGECGVTLNAVVRLTKLAFSYEQWTTYNNLLDCTLIFIKKNQDAESDEVQAEYGKYEFCLALLLTVERVIHVHHPPPPLSTTGTKKSSGEKSSKAAAAHESHGAPDGNSHRMSITGEDLVNLAETVYYCIYEDQTIFLPQGPDQEIVIDRDMILDVTMILWSKCKTIFSKYQIGSIKNDNSSAMMKMGSMGKWLHVLTIVHLSMTYLQVAVYDQALITEVALRLSFALETISKFNLAGGEDQGLQLRPTFSSIGFNPVAQLSNALYVIKSTYTAINQRTPTFTTDDVTRVADVGWVPQDQQKEKFELPIAESLISELQVELMVTYHRITLKLIDMKDSIESIKHMSQEANGYELPAAYIDKVSAKGLKEFVGCSPLCNALLYMQKATRIHATNPSESRKLLNKSLKDIETCQEDELRLFNDSQTRLKDDSAINGDVPSAPVLLARSSTCMVFKPPVFQPNDKKVAWWKIFGRNSSGHNVKVRFNDSYIQGTGEEVPDDENSVFRISGLKANQKYIFAVAAYTASGSVIGGTIGMSSMEIISSYPMSILSVYSHLAQASYITNASKLCRKACSVLWEHFVTTSLQSADHDDSDNDVSTARKDYQLKNHRLDHDKLMHASPLLLRHVMTSIQIGVDSMVREKKLFCDRFSEEGILMTSQMLRIHECEKMLIGIEIAGWLGDSTSYLQCIVQTYGLITPLIQANINSYPFMQVALKCCHGLKSVSPILRAKRSAWVTESLNHMVACLVNYVVKVAKSCGEISLAFWSIRLGKDLINPPPLTRGSKSEKAASVRRKSKSIVQSHELMMLERKFCEMRDTQSTSLELSGNEDPAVVFTRLFELKTTLAFCELTKFRKRTKYMEFFVYVLKRALRCGNVEVGITWCRDMLMTLHKRAEVMNVYKPLPAKKQNDSIAPGHGNKEEASDSKRYAAAVVEFTKASQFRRSSKKDASASNKESIKGSEKDKAGSVGKRYVPFWKKKGSPLVGLNGTPEQEEEEKKAICRLTSYFMPAMRAWQKRRKLRKLTTEETPWRSEFNHLVALMHLHMYFERLHERRRKLGIRENRFQTVEFLDCETWSLTKCKALVVDWTDPSAIRTGDQPRRQSIPRRSSYETVQVVHNEELSIETAARLVITSTIASQKITEGQSEMMLAPTPACGKTEPPTENNDISADITTSALVELFRISMLSFKRSLVLAHRGRHWTLLQNISRDLHSCVKKALHLSRDGDDGKGVTVNQIKSIACKCMSTCADVLIDMLECCNGDNDNDKIEINEEMGGAPFNFDKYSDDVHFIDKKFIIRAVLSAIQLLYIETRWEELIDICLRFSTLTHQRFAETISPILAHAQLKLSERIKHFDGETSPQTHLMSAAARLGKKFPANKDYTRMQLMVSGRDNKKKQAGSLKVVSTFPDQTGGNGDVYGFGKEALALSSVPFDPKHTMGEFNEVMEKSKYASRSLQHSRRLLAIYLASLQRSKEFEFIRKDKEVQLTDIESMVEKGKPSAKNICPPTVKKMSYKKVEINLREGGARKCSTVIDSYSRTIELLKTDARWDLTSQAASELGDIYYHNGNVKTAQNCWNFSLDKALKMKNAARKWEDLLNEKDESKMVENCGVWGCLHAITVAGKLGQYCADNIASKSNYVLLAAQVVKRLFQSTLPHPTTECDYATYELIPASCEENLEILITPTEDRVLPPLPHNRGYNIMNGINVFADEERCNLASIIASLHWICEEMYQLKYYVQMLPLLTLYQYIATFLARDMVRSVMCRTMKLRVLTKLHKFAASSHEAIHLLYGACLPHPTDAGYAPMDNYPLISELDCSKPLMHDDNLHIMEVLAGKRISRPLAAKYGPQLTCDVTIAVASLLSSLSHVIPVMPLRPSPQDYQIPVDPKLRGKRSATKPGSRTTSQLSVEEAGQHVDFIFTMRSTPLTRQLFRGMLLNVAENLLTTVLRTLESGITSSMTSPELWLVVESRLLLADINRQYQLPSIGTLHSLAAINYLQNSSLFSDHGDYDVTDREPSPYTLMEELYRMRLTASFWLRCRHNLCLSASLQIKGLSKVSKEDGGVNDSKVETYCADGLYEADNCKDHEMQAIFLLLGASLDGVTSEESYYMLEDAINSLNEVKHLSYQGQIALAEANIKLTDIGTLIGKITDHQEIIDSYSNARSLLLMKSMEEGEVIEHDRNINYSSIRLPLQNSHLSHLVLLLHTHLRHASSLFKKAIDDKRELEKIIRILEDAEKLSVLSNQHLLLIEIRYQLCKARRLLLSHGGHLPLIHSQTSGTLSRVQSSIKFSFEFLRLICLELALIEIGIVNKQFAADYAPTDQYSPHHSLDSEHDEVEPPATSIKVLLSSTASKKRATNLIYAAFHYQNMERERAALPGNTNIIDVSFKYDDVIDSPHFLIADMMSPGEVIQEGMKRKEAHQRALQQIREDRKQLSDDVVGGPDMRLTTPAVIVTPTSGHNNNKVSITTLDSTTTVGDDFVTELAVDSLLAKMRLRRPIMLTWSHVLYYNLILQRKSKLTPNISQSSHDEFIQGSASTDDEAAASLMSLSTPLNSEDMSLRLNRMSEFLHANLPLYQKTCTLAPQPKTSAFICIQYYRDGIVKEDEKAQVKLIWTCVLSKGSMLDCEVRSVSGDVLMKLTQDLTNLKQKTEEYFSRMEMLKSRQKSKGTETPKIDDILNNQWLEIITQITALLSDTPVENLQEMPFDVTVKTASLLSTLPTIGGYFDHRNPLYKWLSSVLRTHLKATPPKKVRN